MYIVSINSLHISIISFFFLIKFIETKYIPLRPMFGTQSTLFGSVCPNEIFYDSFEKKKNKFNLTTYFIRNLYK